MRLVQFLGFGSPRTNPLSKLDLGPCFTLGFFLRHTYLKKGSLVGRDERIRTSDPLNPIHSKNRTTIEFQQLTLCTERNNAEESRN